MVSNVISLTAAYSIFHICNIFAETSFNKDNKISRKLQKNYQIAKATKKSPFQLTHLIIYDERKKLQNNKI